jgi:hypothetical protein
MRGRGEVRHRLILLAKAPFDCQSFPGICTNWCRRGESEGRRALCQRNLLIPQSHQKPRSALNPACGHVLGTRLTSEDDVRIACCFLDGWGAMVNPGTEGSHAERN